MTPTLPSLRRRHFIGVMSVAVVLTAGCLSGAADVDVIDLNRVLDILAATLDDQADGDAATGGGGSASFADDAEIQPTDPDPAREQAFIDDFTRRLNDAKLVSTPIGVAMQADGSLVGFEDADGDGKRGGGKKIFTIVIDAERNRLIASDTDGHSRPYRYRGGGMLTGFFLGRMLGGQNAFYSGGRAGMRPDLGSRSMSPQNYHSSAVAKARAKMGGSRFGGGAKARSGSGGFSFGK